MKNVAEDGDVPDPRSLPLRSRMVSASSRARIWMLVRSVAHALITGMSTWR